MYCKFLIPDVPIETATVQVKNFVIQVYGIIVDNAVIKIIEILKMVKII